MNPAMNRRSLLRFGAGLAATLALGAGGSLTQQRERIGYDAAALEAHIDATTVLLHHDKHHASYVSKLNEALAHSELHGLELTELVAGWHDLLGDFRIAVRNHGGGTLTTAFSGRSLRL